MTPKKYMNRSSLALVIVFLVSAAAYGQSTPRAHQFNRANLLLASAERAATDENALAARSIAAVKRLERDVMVYRSLGEFEANGRLARVTLEAFADQLTSVTVEVEPMLQSLPEGKLKAEIIKALDSYRDGVFWWEKIDQPRVVRVSALAYSESSRTPSDAAFLATVPYTVAIHWRQASRYLKRAEQLMQSPTRN